MPEPRRFPEPWRVVSIPGGLCVVDASGLPLAYVYGRDDLAGKCRGDALSVHEARKIAGAIARLPELLADELNG